MWELCFGIVFDNCVPCKTYLLIVNNWQVEIGLLGSCCKKITNGWWLSWHYHLCSCWSPLPCAPLSRPTPAPPSPQTMTWTILVAILYHCPAKCTILLALSRLCQALHKQGWQKSVHTRGKANSPLFFCPSSLAALELTGFTSVMGMLATSSLVFSRSSLWVDSGSGGSWTGSEFSLISFLMGMGWNCMVICNYLVLIIK